MRDSGFKDITKEYMGNSFALSTLDISSIRKRVEQHGNAAYRSLLTEWEYEYFDTRKILKRKCDFLSGRLAGKKAAREYLDSSEIRAGKNLRFNDIEIMRTDTGAPSVHVDDKQSDLLISISHSGTCAVSIVSGEMNYRGIGIDIEHIEKRDISFLDLVFNDGEIAKLEIENKCDSGEFDTGLNENITRCWTIKEAILKSLGLGLNVDLKDIDIIEPDTSNLHFEIKDEVKSKYDQLKAAYIKVDTFKMDEYVVSISRIH